MATVSKRPSGKWQAIVRRDGRSHSKTFTKRADANKWARETEVLAEQGLLQQTSSGVFAKMSLGQVLEKYRDEITSKKRCASNETYAINGFLRSSKNMHRKSIDKLRAVDFTQHRDKRLQCVKPATVVRELGWLQQAIDIAGTECGQCVPNGNPVKQVWRPRVSSDLLPETSLTLM